LKNIYKFFFGNKIIFDEINHDVNVIFRYEWNNSEKFGFVKKSSLTNLDNSSKNISVLDGIRNILPAGVDYNFQNEFSNLLDAYKKNELLKKSRIGLFTLSSIPVDRAEPSEAPYATTVWSRGLQDYKILLSDKQFSNFRLGETLKTEHDIRATRGAFVVQFA